MKTRFQSDKQLCLCANDQHGCSKLILIKFSLKILSSSLIYLSNKLMPNIIYCFCTFLLSLKIVLMRYLCFLCFQFAHNYLVMRSNVR